MFSNATRSDYQMAGMVMVALAGSMLTSYFSHGIIGDLGNSGALQLQGSDAWMILIPWISLMVFVVQNFVLCGIVFWTIAHDQTELYFRGVKATSIFAVTAVMVSAVVMFVGLVLPYLKAHLG